MKISDIIEKLEAWAPPVWQEDYDNGGLITGNAAATCTGVLVSLDATEAVIDEAIANGFNMVLSHHPIVFRGLKKFTADNYVERAVLKAIRHDIALYAIHTNLDNVAHGVNKAIADKIGLVNTSILDPKAATLSKLYTFVPVAHAAQLRAALFAAGAGVVSRYSECSFNSEGTGTFKAGDGTDPFVGEPGLQHQEHEMKIEVIFPHEIEGTLIRALKANHPYEEVAFDVVRLANQHPGIGSGLVGSLTEPVDERQFLSRLFHDFGLEVIRHSGLTGRQVSKVAVCGGAGSFLISKALQSGADFFVTGDVKYHDFFDANDRLVVADIGHFESEQFTIDLLDGFLQRNFLNFATLKTTVRTNPVHYYRS